MKSNVGKFGGYLIIGLISSIITLFLYRYIAKPQVIFATSTPTAQISKAAHTTVINQGTPDFVKASQSGIESVAYIQSIQLLRNNFWGGKEYGYSTGSGVIMSEDGYVLSNRHVIKDATEIKVTLNDNREYTAELVGEDKNTDLALLKIKEAGLPFLTFGNSDSVFIGEWVLAIGNPFKLQSTVTAGIVSAKARNLDITESNTGIESFIQTDAAVNSGNSGGALLNTEGELIGINTAIISYSGQYEGYSFAVPSNIVRKIFLDLKEFGRTQRGWLDITVSSMNQNRAESLKIDEIEGVYIDAVFEGGAAQLAGLRAGDLIVGIQGTQIQTVPEFMGEIAQFRPGDDIELHVIREGVPTAIMAILSSKEEEADMVEIMNNEPLLRKLGIEIGDLNETTPVGEATTGIAVISVRGESQADWAQLEAGFIITHINDLEIDSVEQFLTALHEVHGNFILAGVYPDKQGDWMYELRSQ